MGSRCFWGLWELHDLGRNVTEEKEFHKNVEKDR